MHTTIIINSVAELIVVIRPEGDSKNSPIHWFRGQEKSRTWELKPKVFRTAQLKAHERNFVHRFRSRAGIRYLNAPKYNEFALWLSLMQHHGLPTRLLDWSRSPLVAAYFAIENILGSSFRQDRKPAAIWMLDPFKLNEMEGLGSVTPSIEAQMVAPVINPAFLGEALETERVLAVMASEFDLRMFVQQCCFTIHSDRTELNSRPSNNEYLKKLEIPANALVKFATEIRACGFRKGDIYPDLPNLAQELVTEFG